MDFMDLDGVNVEMDFLLRPDDPTLGLLDAELGSAFFNDLDAPLGDYLDNTVEDQFCNKLLDQMEDMEPETDHAYAALSPGGSVGSASGSSFSGDHGYLSPSTSPVDVLDTATQEIFEVPHQTTYELKQRSQPVQRQPPRPYQLPPVAPKRPSLVAPSRNSGGPRTVIRFKPALRASGGTIAGSTPAASSSLLAPSSIKLSGPSTKLTGVGGERTRKYPPLTLTDEEKRLCKKEGIQLPDHYPLTKAEERDLKRIRRKIRNKRSAQTSRKRKQDYIEQLEDRVADCSQENHELKMRIEELSRENESIVAQLRKLQTSLGQGSRRGVQAGTCLAVLVLSMCLLVAPNLSPFGKIRAIESEEQTLAIQRAQHRLNRREVGQAPVHGRSRTLMDFVQNPPTADEYCADEVAKVEKIEEAAVPQEPPKNFYRDNESKKKPVSNNQKPVNGRFKEPPPKGYQYAGDVDLPPPPNPKNVIHYVPARLVQTGNSNNYTNKVYAQQPPSTQPPPAKRFKTEPL